MQRSKIKWILLALAGTSVTFWVALGPKDRPASAESTCDKNPSTLARR